MGEAGSMRYLGRLSRLGRQPAPAHEGHIIVICMHIQFGTSRDGYGASCEQIVAIEFDPP